MREREEAYSNETVMELESEKAGRRSFWMCFWTIWVGGGRQADTLHYEFCSGAWVFYLGRRLSWWLGTIVGELWEELMLSVRMLLASLDCLLGVIGYWARALRKCVVFIGVAKFNCEIRFFESSLLGILVLVKWLVWCAHGFPSDAQFSISVQIYNSKLILRLCLITWGMVQHPARLKGNWSF